jgi:meso-butanediol dehydrogenase / (S,S)-butanediol dehydrogenase / diacetyl reductase
MGTLDGKVVLISGTAGGQGRAAARAFAREGARVMGCDVKESEAQETVAIVNNEGGQMRSLTLDVSEPDNAATWIRTASEAWGQIDVLYNNASSLRAKGPFSESTLEEWNLTLRFELTMMYVTSRAVWSHLVDGGGGLIINIASIVGHQELQSLRTAAHGAAKAGVIGFTRMLAAEGAPHNIRAVSISPGFIRTPATKYLFPEGSQNQTPAGEARVREIPMGRAGEADEIANVALFLASSAASYINATDIVVDGGFLGVSYGAD